MKIRPAKALANLLRLLTKLGIMNIDELDKAIDKIQVWVFDEIDRTKSVPKDLQLP